MPTGAKCLCAGTCLSESPIICLRLVLILFSKVIIFLLNLTFLCLFSFLSILFSPFYSSVTFIKSLTRHLVFLFYTHVSLLYNAMEYTFLLNVFFFLDLHWLMLIIFFLVEISLLSIPFYILYLFMISHH